MEQLEGRTINDNFRCSSNEEHLHAPFVATGTFDLPATTRTRGVGECLVPSAWRAAHVTPRWV